LSTSFKYLTTCRINDWVAASPIKNSPPLGGWGAISQTFPSAFLHLTGLMLAGYCRHCSLQKQTHR
jgi:hypothetical protein